jgi:UDP-N-acetylmuramoylalanine--D-glutamate ligase
MDYKGKRVLVVGGGLSGIAAARKLLLLGAEVFLTDRQSEDKLSGLKTLGELGLDNGHLVLEKEPDIAQIKPDLLVLSPGVSPRLPFIEQASAQGIPLWSEVELALRDSAAFLVGITGSNGKTTTTTLCGELAK